MMPKRQEQPLEFIELEHDPASSILDDCAEATKRARHDAAAAAFLAGKANSYITNTGTGRKVTCCFCGDGSCQIGPMVTRDA